MARGRDVVKQREWERRLLRFSSSGMTIARFCESERVAVSSFHYWSRQFRPQSVAPLGTHARTSPDREAMVELRFDGGVQLAIPVRSLDALRCVVETLAQGRAQFGAFQQVVVRDAARKDS